MRMIHHKGAASMSPPVWPTAHKLSSPSCGCCTNMPAAHLVCHCTVCCPAGVYAITPVPACLLLQGSAALCVCWLACLAWQALGDRANYMGMPMQALFRSLAVTWPHVHSRLYWCLPHVLKPRVCLSMAQVSWTCQAGAGDFLHLQGYATNQP